jgi:hypothetical protein
MRDNGHGLNDAQRTESAIIAAEQKGGPMHVWRFEQLPEIKGDCRWWTMMCVWFEHCFLPERRAIPLTFASF